MSDALLEISVKKLDYTRAISLGSNLKVSLLFEVTLRFGSTNLLILVQIGYLFIESGSKFGEKRLRVRIS